MSEKWLKDIEKYSELAHTRSEKSSNLTMKLKKQLNDIKGNSDSRNCLKPISKMSETVYSLLTQAPKSARTYVQAVQTDPDSSLTDSKSESKTVTELKKTRVYVKLCENRIKNLEQRLSEGHRVKIDMNLLEK